MTASIALLLVGGFVALLVGGELLVRYSARFATLVGLSPLVIGLTIVAFGTSAPEMAVSVLAGLDGAADVAVGNVVGSNIFNVLFILGACAAISPLFVGKALAWIDVPIMIGTALLVPFFARDGAVAAAEGALLLAGLATYTWFVVRRERKNADSQGGPVAGDGKGGSAAVPSGSKLATLGLILVGLAILVVGSRWFVDGSVELAQAFGVSELVIGLTIVAAGTSLPEVMTSILATIRGQREIAAGNVVGSNIFNVLGVLGASTLTAGRVPVAQQVLSVDAPLMIAVSAALLAAVGRGLVIGRIQGLAFLAAYAGYTTWLVLAAQGSPSLSAFQQKALWYGVPLLGLLVVTALFRRRPAIATAQRR